MRSVGIAATAAVVLGAAHTAAAATHCVRPGGGAGCTSTITAAVGNAAPGDTILVSRGTYAEDVLVTKPLFIIGEDRDRTIVDATGLANGFDVDGFDNPGLSRVAISGFTIEHAQTEGILVSNASDVRLSDNILFDNDEALGSQGCTVFVPPDNAAGEGLDCGEAIHLTGVDHSIVADNIVRRNSGGILISDDSGPTYENLITGNTVADNPFDCGITLASHNPAAPNGVFHNTVEANTVSGNGLKGEGAGVGLFTPAPGTATYGNVVVANRLVNNRLPGVAMHSHAPNQNLNDNQIVGNYIAGNGADTADAETPGRTGINVFGVTPITGTTIEGNTIEHEDVAISVKTSSTVDAHFNNLDNHAVGVANLNGGTVDATENWWGCPRGPKAGGCSTVSGANVIVYPWLAHPAPKSW
ncbi:MAG TPA: NosD domain-containing protein [Vicinamibacterales bacterium]|nr:NosD domain-containing protein [Vicinamibacterales bacterium]